MVTTLTEYDEMSVVWLSPSRIRNATATATAASSSGMAAARTADTAAASPDRGP